MFSRAHTIAHGLMSVATTSRPPPRVSVVGDRAQSRRDFRTPLEVITAAGLLNSAKCSVRRTETAEAEPVCWFPPLVPDALPCAAKNCSATSFYPTNGPPSFQ